MKKLVLFIFFFIQTACFAQKADSLTLLKYDDAFLDTVKLEKPQLNNYSMIGVNYGVNFCGAYLNPEFPQRWFFTPGYYSVMFSHYEKLFDYLPYFGFTVGVAYGRQGYQFDKDKETGVPVRTIRGAEKCVTDIIEVPFLIDGHFDADNLRIMMNAGLYGGYRTKIQRWGNVEDELADHFDAMDIRWDYGIMAGAGIGYALDPFEFHIRALFRMSWNYFIKPDYLSSEKFYFTSPMGVIVQFGVYYQLSKRRGRTSRSLRQAAKQYVYGNENN